MVDTDVIHRRTVLGITNQVVFIASSSNCEVVTSPNRTSVNLGQVIFIHQNLHIIGIAACLEAVNFKGFLEDSQVVHADLDLG